METDILDFQTTSAPILENISESSTNGTNEIALLGKIYNAGAFCFVILTIVGISGNFVTILALAKYPQLRNATTAFIINLAVTDLTLSCFTFPLQAASYSSKHGIYGNDALCRLFGFVTHVTGMVSIYTITSIAINSHWTWRSLAH